MPLLLLSLAAVLAIQPAQSRPVSQDSAGQAPRTLAGTTVIAIDSRALGEQREVWVDAPSTCHGRAACDTLIVLDADALFPLATAYATVMRTMGRLRPIIVVGVPSRSTDDRIRNFTSSVRAGDRTRYAQAGGAPRFREFLLTEVAPAIASRFGSAGNRVLAGHSLAGLFAIDTFLRGHVDHAIAISPTLGWNDGAVVTEFEHWFKNTPPASNRLYVSVADGDAEVYRQTFDRLRRIGSATRATVPGVSFTVRVNEDHVTTVAPALQDAMLRFFAR
jgi:predicted alpha/beta superfamily hydrolase